MYNENILTNADKNTIKAKVFRVKDASRYLGISKATFWRWVQQGKLPKGTKFSQRCTVWKVEDLDKFIENAMNCQEAV